VGAAGVARALIEGEIREPGGLDARAGH
jgi:hypothetical protein